ncbi:MAG: hypothetical protein IH599_08120 [Bacteroidales bacterium]|nr:hypothetical protein [Bacteroidales bacterium]
MKNVIALYISIFLWHSITAQNTPNNPPVPTESRTIIGGYGQIDLNAPIGNVSDKNMDLDVHRVVLMVGHKFSDRVSMLTEIEFEHVKEVYIEQAYLDYRIKPWLSFRGGLLLVPMGIINLYHESATFHSVERPLIDHSLVPTTWREIGAGFSGTLLSAGVKYEAYLINGFLSHNGDAGLLGGSNGLRSGRQKGAESIMKHPNLAARAEYFGLDGLQAGLSLYAGKTQSALYSYLGTEISTAMADSSVVGLLMLGLDARYTLNGWQFRAQAYHSNVTGSAKYNAYTGKDLGQAMAGYYVEAAYDLFHTSNKTIGELYPYVRYSAFDMHLETERIQRNPSYRKRAVTAGLNFLASPGAAFKIGYQYIKSENDDTQQVFQAGVGFTF